MTLDAYIQDATVRLQSVGISSARLDILILVEDTLRIDRSSALAHPERELQSDEITTLDSAVQQRLVHTPLAYIRGKAAFYGRQFAVNPAVLVPRPESEVMISLLLKLPLTEGARIIDVGTGSGCLGITAALELPTAIVTLTDIDSHALAVAQRNALALGARVTHAQQDLLKSDDGTYDVVLANLPYVPDAYPINAAARHEPTLALFAGRDGLDAYRALWQHIEAQSTQPRYVLTESLLAQHDALAELAQQHGYSLAETHGLIQLFTVQGR